MTETAKGVGISAIRGRFGAEVVGLDLSRALPDPEFRRIERAWFDASSWCSAHW